MSLSAKIVACLQELGVEPSTKTFESRRIVQKLAYLVQVAGIELGLRFRWYLHGPYCMELTKAIYEEGLVYEILPKLDAAESSTLRELRDFLGDRIHDGDYLELIVSLHYARKMTEEDPIPKDELLRDFLARKPYYSAEQVEDCWRELEDFEKRFGRVA